MSEPANMKNSTSNCVVSEGDQTNINSELWHACAGPLVSLPDVGSYCVYLPQGHSEQVAASTQQDVAAQMPNYHPNLRPQLVCRLHDLVLNADADTDEVYCRMTLQPVNVERESCLVSDNTSQSKQPSIFFCKMLTASDTSTHGGFSIPRRAAERVFPALDFSLQPPAQEIIARDLHDTEWRFRHIFRGQPKRHLLTTGWSVFVSAKRLMAGDSILFMRNDKNNLFLGIRRANRPQTFIPSSVLSSDSMHMGVLAAAAHAASTNSRFMVYYNPRASPSEFVVPLSKFEKAVYHTKVLVGMRFRMLFETEESSVRRYMGTITHVGDLDPVRWPNSPWRSIKVGWDESTTGDRPKRVSLWEIEPLTTFLVYPPPSNWRLRPSWPLLTDKEFEGSRTSETLSQFQHTGRLPYPSSAMSPVVSSVQHVYNFDPGSGMFDVNKAPASQDCFIINQQLQHRYIQQDEPQLKGRGQLQQHSLHPSLLQSRLQQMHLPSQGSLSQTFHPLASYQKPNDPYVQHAQQCGTLLQADGQPGYPSLQQTFQSSFDQLHHQCPYQINESSTSQVANTGSIQSMTHSSQMNSVENGGLVAPLPSPVPVQCSTFPPNTVYPGVRPSNHTLAPNASASWVPPQFPGNSQVSAANFNPIKSEIGICQSDAAMQTNYSSPMMPWTTDTTQKPLVFNESNVDHFSEATTITTLESVQPDSEIEGFYNQHINQCMQRTFPGESMELSNAPIPDGQLSNDQCFQAMQVQGDADPPTRTYTKVYKSGSVGRSLDLARCHDYNELRCQLGRFFGLEGQLDDPGSGWKLVFLDKEDDWLLLGDDPWEVFIENVRSLKILSPVEFLGFRNEVSMQQQQGSIHKSEDAIMRQQECHYSGSTMA